MALKLKRNIVEQYQFEQVKQKNYTILLVDDEAANLRSLTRILEDDFHVITAINGARALDIVNSLSPPRQIHLIISDQRMPMMTGVELFEQIIVLMPDSIRMILTGFADINAIIDAINRGAVYKFLTKPIEPRDLRITVQRALEAFELTQKNVALMKELMELNASLEHKITERTRELADKQQDLERLNAELEQQIAIVERLSITDELTQLYNRRYFNTIFPKEIQRAAREKQTVSFLIFDLDCFKQYNDNYGHQKGDDVLKAIGQLLKTQCQRASDAAFRLGGEEFGVIFISLTQEEAWDFANTICQVIADMQIEHLFSSAAKHITASFGLVTLPATPDLNIDDFYKQADEALYQAKGTGRNKVVCMAIEK